MTTKAKIQMKANKYPFAQELITDTEGNIRKVVIDFDDYQRLLEAIEDEGLILAIEQEIPENDQLIQQHKALSKLTKEWIEEGDEQEQTETWEYLRQALDEDRLSNRPLFP